MLRLLSVMNRLQRLLLWEEKGNFAWSLTLCPCQQWLPNHLHSMCWFFSFDLFFLMEWAKVLKNKCIMTIKHHVGETEKRRQMYLWEERMRKPCKCQVSISEYEKSFQTVKSLRWQRSLSVLHWAWSDSLVLQQLVGLFTFWIAVGELLEFLHILAKNISCFAFFFFFSFSD